MLCSHRPYVMHGTRRTSRSQGSSITSFNCHAPAQSAPQVQRASIWQRLQSPQQWSDLAVPLLQAAAVVAVQLQLAVAGHAAAAELIESNMTSEGSIPSQLSASGETAAPKLSSLIAGTNKKPIEGCTRKCVPTCIRGGEGAPGLGPISVRKEIVVFKDGFRSRQYCLSECAQVCSITINKENSSSSGSSSGDSSSSSSSTEQQRQANAAAAAPAAPAAVVR